MPNFDKIIAGIGVLIFVFLLFDKSRGATQVFSALGDSSSNLIRTLQGRG